MLDLHGAPETFVFFVRLCARQVYINPESIFLFSVVTLVCTPAPPSIVSGLLVLRITREDATTWYCSTVRCLLSMYPRDIEPALVFKRFLQCRVCVVSFSVLVG